MSDPDNPFGPTWRAESLRRLRELEDLSKHPESWPALSNSKFKEMAAWEVSRYRLNFDSSSVLAVYRMYVNRIPYDERRVDLLALLDRLNTGAAVWDSLLPFVLAETAWGLVSTAVLETAQRMDLENNDPMTGVKTFRQLIERSPQFKDERRAAILAGLLLLGDRRAVPILRGTWRLLGQEGRIQLSKSWSDFVYASVIEFYLDWLEDSEERDFGKIAAALVRMPFIATNGKVLDVERPFPIGTKSAPPKLIYQWTIQEYGRLIEPRLRDLLRREDDPRFLPFVMEAWDIERLASRKLNLDEIVALAANSEAGI